MKRLVILGGAVHDTPLLREICKQNEFDQVIAADSGLNWSYRLGIRPDLMMGDFDSVEPEILAYYANPESTNYKEMIQDMYKELNFTTRNFNRLDDMIDPVGISACKLCTYCWNGKE